MYDLTVLVPGIRTHNWVPLYDSIPLSTKRSWEMVFIGPYAPPPELAGKSNIKFFQDFGSPIRCQQLGLVHAAGKWVTWAADDGYFLPMALDIAFDKVQGCDYKTVIVGKYYEGEGNESLMGDGSYYRLSYHDSTKSVFVPDNYLTLNVGIITTQLLLELGGWDAQEFEVCPMAYADFAVRAQRHGATFILQDEVMFKCGHMPGTTGDHGPIHYAQTEHDEPTYRGIYGRDACKNRLHIDIDNWQHSPSRWMRRFSG